MLKPLHEDFSFVDKEFLKVPIWVKFPNLPLKLWNDDAMSEVASMVGVPLTTDKVTQDKSNHHFARVLIEVDVSKPPKLSFPIRLPSRKIFKQHVVYETFPNFCFHCKEYGHHPFICKALAEKEKVANGQNVTENVGKTVSTKQDDHNEFEQERNILEITCGMMMPVAAIEEPVDAFEEPADASVEPAAAGALPIAAGVEPTAAGALLTAAGAVMEPAIAFVDAGMEVVEEMVAGMEAIPPENATASPDPAAGMERPPLAAAAPDLEDLALEEIALLDVENPGLLDASVDLDRFERVEFLGRDGKKKVKYLEKNRRKKPGRK
ncbi:unnamed protein product [Cuscuta europaea]|uniref:DUF4283 domain-containing protein n=1 Tax=Cuscuta europaea TaxID=41803 RepID=A0A9P0ZY74_CUSEU|nr:unnamed protein product [Cuscuta europaea]